MSCQSWLPFVETVLVAVLVAITAWYAHSAKKLLKEMQKQRRASLLAALANAYGQFHASNKSILMPADQANVIRHLKEELRGEPD